MSDFASAAMMRVLVQGMRELGLAPAATREDPARDGRVALDDKRALVAEALRRGGPGCLALLGRGLHRCAREPTHAALACARDAPDLIRRWLRLERYVHSRHRTEVRSIAPGAAELRHVAIAGLPPPLAVEDLVVAGVLAALLEAAGLRDVRIRAGGARIYPEADDAALAAAIAHGRTADWSLRWEEPAHRPPPAPAEGTPAAASAHPPGPAAAGPPDLFATDPWPPVVRDAARRLASDLLDPPPPAALAEALGTSARTLQRSLAAAGTGHAALLGEARCRAAAWWLLHTREPIAAVGFVCGYADQPHLTRALRARTGLTPARYRAEFAA